MAELIEKGSLGSDFHMSMFGVRALVDFQGGAYGGWLEDGCG